MRKKVLIGMSGGVDSSAAASLLKDQGYDVAGFHMQLGPASGSAAARDAEEVCKLLDIPFYLLPYEDLFQKKVIENFLEEYAQGRTPNPCVECNKHLKFGAAIEKMHQLGADYVATGHYAQIFQREDGRFLLRQAADTKKDQTYMLYHLSQQQLSHIIMPLYGMTKEQVRRYAKMHGLPVASKSDSQDICFLAGGRLIDFFRAAAPELLRPGDIVDKSGTVLGRHCGTSLYTIGQRRGLGVASDHKLYVSGIDSHENRIVLDEEASLFSSRLYAKNVNYIPFDRLEFPMEVTAKIRYAARPSKAVLRPWEDGVMVEFESPQRAITPGQSVVFYDGDLVVGGGIIERKM